MKKTTCYLELWNPGSYMYVRFFIWWDILRLNVTVSVSPVV